MEGEERKRKNKLEIQNLRGKKHYQEKGKASYHRKKRNLEILSRIEWLSQLQGFIVQAMTKIKELSLEKSLLAQHFKTIQYF